MNQVLDLKCYLMYNFNQIRFSCKVAGVMSVFGVAISLNDILYKWFYENFDYVAIALLLVAIDHLLGSVVHQFYKSDFDWKKNIIGLLIKLSMVVCAGLVFEGLAHITREQDLIYSYLKMITRLIVCVYPALSAMHNMRIITNGAFPPAALVGKFKSFQNDLDLEKLKKRKEDEGD